MIMVVKKLDPGGVPIREPVTVFEAKVNNHFGEDTLEFSIKPGMSALTTLEGEHADLSKYPVGSKLIVDCNLHRGPESGFGEVLRIYDSEGNLIKDRVPDIRYSRGPVQRRPED